MDSTNPKHTSPNTSADPTPRQGATTVTLQLDSESSSTATTTTTTTTTTSNNDVTEDVATKTTTTTPTVAVAPISAVSKVSHESHYGPVIVHEGLLKSRIKELLASHGIKVRVSSNVLEGSIIWSKARLAFLDVDLTSLCTDPGMPSTLPSRHSPVDNDIAVVGALSSHVLNRYIGSKTDFLVAHHAEDCVKAMMTIVVLQVPPHSDRQHARFCDVMKDLMTVPI